MESELLAADPRRECFSEKAARNGKREEKLRQRSAADAQLRIATTKTSRAGDASTWSSCGGGARRKGRAGSGTRLRIKDLALRDLTKGPMPLVAALNRQPRGDQQPAPPFPAGKQVHRAR